MKRLISLSLILALSAPLASKPAKANPAAALPLTLCSTGVGCILVGTAIIGGVVVYIWKRNDGRRVYADKGGNVLRSEMGEYLPDSDAQPQDITDETVAARTANSARAKCQAIAKKYGGVSYKDPKTVGKGIWQCYIRAWR